MALSGFGLAHKKLIFFQGISGRRAAGTTLAFAVTLFPPPPRTMSLDLAAALGADAVSNHTEKPAAQGRRACVFYKLIVETIIQEKQLGLPKRFVQKFGDELSNAVTLTTPSSGIWQVGLRKANQRLWFDGGWQRFIEHHSVCAGYFLVFQYERNSNFLVYMFNLTASTEFAHTILGRSEELSHGKQVAFPLEQNQESSNILKVRKLSPAFPISSYSRNKASTDLVNQKRSDHIYSVINLEDHKHEIDGKNLLSRNHSDFLHLKGNNTRDIGVQVDVNELREAGIGVQSPLSHQSRYPKRRKQIAEPDEKELSAEEKLGSEPSPSGDVSSQSSSRQSKAARLVTAEARDLAIRASEMFEPDGPFCRVVMQPSFVHGKFILHLPSSFARMHLKDLSGDIKLQLPGGKQWPVRRIFNRSKASKISRGWRKFVTDNNLEEGDVCIFELAETEDVVLNVTIIRVLEDRNSQQ
ncbi:hypothetical protein NL676_015587 [Syzygium grande]|nr:hypothetical protein NL676_015587 [Syzygium grande]